MGLKDLLKKAVGDFQEAHELYKIGCEVMGPGNPNSPLDRGDRIAAGRRELARRADVHRQRLEGRWASRFRSDTGKIDVLIDKNGNPTTAYPHVHIVYNTQEDKVRVILSLAPKNHPSEEILPGDADGNRVNEAVRRMQQRMP